MLYNVQRGRPVMLIALTLLMATACVFAIHSAWRLEQASSLNELRRELSRVASEAAADVSHYRAMRLADASSARDVECLSDSWEAALNEPGDPSGEHLAASYIAWLVRKRGYAAGWLMDAGGEVKVSVAEHGEAVEVSADEASLARRTAREGGMVLTCERARPHTAAGFNVAVAVPAGREPLGVLVLRVDGAALESLLSRHRRTRPGTRIALVQSMVGDGEGRGGAALVDGPDRGRGAAPYAVAPVPGSSWQVVASIEPSELAARAADRRTLFITLAIACIGFWAAALLLVLRDDDAKHWKRICGANQRLAASSVACLIARSASSSAATSAPPIAR